MDRALKLEQDFLECFSGKRKPWVFQKILTGFPHKCIPDCNFDVWYLKLLLDLRFAHSCRGRGKLWGGLPQSKESDRRAIGALYLDPYSGEAVMLQPQDPTTFTSTAPYRHSLSQSRPRPPACPPAKPGRGPSPRKTERQRSRPKRDSDAETNRVMGNLNALKPGKKWRHRFSTLRKSVMLTLSVQTRLGQL